MNPDGSTYFGQSMHGLRHGLGIYTIALEENADLRRLYAGEFLKGKRHGFAIERIMWKDKVCKSCVVTEYHGDVKIESEVVTPGLFPSRFMFAFPYGRMCLSCVQDRVT